MSLRAALLLAAIGLLATSLLAGLELATRARIAEQAQQRALERLAEVLPPDRYDNDPLAESFEIEDSRLGPGRHRVHLGRLQGQPSALAVQAIASDGYAGPIELLIGIDRDGRVLGVRVLRHQETPGLGDPIERRRSDWILGFDGRHLGDPPPSRWTVRRDGGDFDQFTGATITPRAVTVAIRRALEFHASEHDRLYRQPMP